MTPCAWAGPRLTKSCCNCFATIWPRLEFRMTISASLYLKQGLEQLKDFLAGTRSAPPPEVLHTEEWFDVQIAGTKVAGRIDRIDRAPDGSVIHRRLQDRQGSLAGRRRREPAAFDLRHGRAARSGDTAWAHWCFTISKATFPLFSKRTEFQLEEARERVLAVARGIAEGNFEPKPDFHCNFCAFRGLCPAREKRVPNVAANTAKSAESRSTDSRTQRQTSAQKLRGRFRRPPFSTSY